MKVLFSISIFLGAALLFLIEPMVAKQVLPLLGGSPQVWNTCMVFFQGALLAGYAYAHLLSKARPLVQVVVHAVVTLLPLAVLPISVHDLVFPPGSSTGAVLFETPVSPVRWLLVILALTAGLPFFAIAGAGPLLQRWFSRTTHRSAADPYFLYAASNAGSLLGLMAYPLLLEPLLTMPMQARAWTGGYIAFLLATGACALVTLAPRDRADATSPADMEPAPTPTPTPRPSITWPTRLRWVILALIPSSLMLGVTHYITTDIAAVPLLWTIPLAIYLITFIVAFGVRADALIRPASILLGLLTLGVGLTFLLEARYPIWLLILLHLGLLGAAGLLCHARLASERPDPSHLTEFYLLISVGGVLGGSFNALLAPLIFNRILEYPIAIVLACAFRQLRRPASTAGHGAAHSQSLPEQPASRAASDPMLWIRWVKVGLPEILGIAMIALIVKLCAPGIAKGVGRDIVALPPALALAALAMMRTRLLFAIGAAALFTTALLTPAQRDNELLTQRTFFGVLRVTAIGRVHYLQHGTTLHGAQDMDPAHAGTPLTYYYPTGPLGKLFTALNHARPVRNIAVVGLGAGAIAAHARPGQQLHFYEIDPAVVRIAQDPRYFTALDLAAARTGSCPSIFLGDGRLNLAAAPDGLYDLIILDAFSSDAIPTHLLTREAVRMYATKLAPGGLLVFNTSNRYFDLVPVLDAVARAEGMHARFATDDYLTDEESRAGKNRSQWAALGRTLDDFKPLRSDPSWMQVADPPPGQPWSDDYSDIISAIKWNVAPPPK